MRRAIIIILICFVSALVQASPRAIKGVLDLSTIDFGNRSTNLDGEWAFYWDQLLVPGDSSKLVTYTEFPSIWTTKSDLPSFGFATYRLQVILPEGRKQLTLHCEDMYCAYALYINGEKFFGNGKVANNKQDYQAEWKPDFIDLTNLKDTNEFLLQIANFDHSKGGAGQGFEIGSSEFMKSQQTQILAYDFILTGSLIMGGLFFLGLYFFGHYDKAMLYFSLFCITYSYRIMGVGYYSLHHVVDMPWGLGIRLEYISLFLGVFLFGKFIEKLYPQEINQILWKSAYLITISFSLATLVLSPKFFTQLIAPFFVVLLFYLALTIWVYFKAFKKKRIGSEYALLSTAVVFLVFAYNIFVYFGWLLPSLAASFWGYILFFFAQSLILSFRFAYFLKTEKVRAEIASQAKTDFLSTISHEIRTPLNAVVGISHLLLQEKPRNDQKENLISLKFSAEHLTSLINDILDYNKLESGNVEFEEMNVDLCELGQRIYHSYKAKAHEKGLELKYEFDSGIKPKLILDATRMSQVLNNLIDNAIKFTSQGEIKMYFKLIDTGIESQTIQFEVIDTGLGIPEDKLNLIFERFTQASSSTTREFGGSGLGLSIVKKLLELQGADIKVKSTPQNGSTFYFNQTFKIVSPLLMPSAPVNIDETVELSNKYILLVEDNHMNVLVAGKFLKKWGIHYDVASNGQKALEQIQTHQYDLVLMDLQMPVMDGYQATEQIRKLDKVTPIIALTASALFNVQENVLKAGMNDYVTKPFDPKELRRKIEKHIRA